jgi:putative transposase
VGRPLRAAHPKKKSYEHKSGKSPSNPLITPAFNLKYGLICLKLISMPVPPTFKAPFYCDQFYHLVFESIDGLFLFRNHENRIFFLQKFLFFFRPVLTCWSYCLLDNHAHFIVHIKNALLFRQSLIEIPDTTRTVAMMKFLSNPEDEFTVDELIERQANRFMVSYANSYNKVYSRRGGLFQSPFRRSTIQEDGHLQQAIIYVHANAQKHGLITDYRNHLYSSYHEIINGASSIIDVPAVINFFGGTGTIY